MTLNKRSETIRVLFIDYIRGEIGGGHFVLARLANHFFRNDLIGIEPSVCLNNYKGFVDKHIETGVKVWELNIPGDLLALNRKSTFAQFISRGFAILRFLIGFGKRLRKYCAASDIEVVHANGITCFILAALALRLSRTRLLFHFHDPLLTASEGGNQMGDLALRLILLFMKYFADQIVTVSEFVRGTILNRDAHLDGKLAVIHNGVIINGVHGSQPPIGKEKPALLSFGTLSKRKGFHLGIKAAAILKAEFHLAFEYLILGDGPCREELTGLARQLGVEENVQFLGFQDNVTPFIREADIVIVPSAWPDPLPLVVMESMSQQKCVIATAVGGIPEVIVDGESGILVPLDDAAVSIAMNVRYLVENPDVKESMARKAEERVQQYFSMERMSRAFARVYRDLSRGKPKGSAR